MEMSSYQRCEYYILTPLWYNETLRLPLKPHWFKRGISIIADLIDENYTLLSMADFQESYSFKTNFLEYGGLMLIVNFLLNNQEITTYRPNCQISTLLTSY